MNHPAPGGLVAASILLAGAVWATVVTYAWPESQPPTVNATAADAASERRRSASAVQIYAVLFAAAAGIGLALGYLLDLTHVA
jgi:hypothetical protein